VRLQLICCFFMILNRLKYKYLPCFVFVVVDVNLLSLLYTVNHKKTCHFVFDYNSSVTCSIFTIFLPVETGRNTVQFSYLMA